MTDKKDIATVLAFERKLDPSDALFFAGNWEDRNNSKKWPAILIREKAVRGTISNRLKTKDADPAKLDAEVEKANLQRIDVATLPNDCDTLKICFTLRVLGGVGDPSVCNNSNYREKLRKVVDDYVGNHGFNELAQRYAYNLANGRFLWRNRIGAESIEINVHQQANGKAANTMKFNAFDLPLRNFEAPENIKEKLNELSKLIASGLQGDHILLKIEAYVRMGEGQETFPSQELVLNESKGQKKGQKSRLLYKVNNIAAIHSQKIGNAIRTIDTWYQDDDNNLGPIAVEPYGSVTTLGKAFRQPKQKMDFYNLFDKWVLTGAPPEDAGNQHFVMATLIRGGVFGESGKE